MQDTIAHAYTPPDISRIPSGCAKPEITTTYAAALALGALAERCQFHQSLIGSVDGAISRLWQLAKQGYTAASRSVKEQPGPSSLTVLLAAVINDHGLNQSYLVQQDGFMEDLLQLRADNSDLFSYVVTPLSNNPEFVQRLCNTPTAVPTLTSALNSYWSQALLLSMCKAQPSTILTINSQPGVVDKLQKLSGEKEKDGKQRYPDAASLLQLVIPHSPPCFAVGTVESIVHEHSEIEAVNKEASAYEEPAAADELAAGAASGRTMRKRKAPAATKTTTKAPQQQRKKKGKKE
jgi:hypothetical protein